MDPADYALAEDSGPILAVVHSHPDAAPLPSQADLVACERTGIPWFILGWPTEIWHFMTPKGYRAPLIGREFVHGVLDCYTLIRDWYQEVRSVSLLDFEDFARSFSGIGKAQARMLWQRGRRLVHLTVAGVGGRPIDADPDLIKKLRAALDLFRDPFQELVIESFDRRLFRVKLRVKVDRDHLREAVLQRVETALRDAFSFDARDFGQSLFLSEVMAVAQRAEGVVYVDVDHLYQDGKEEKLNDQLTAQPARIGDAGEVLPAQILLLSPLAVVPEAIP